MNNPAAVANTPVKVTLKGYGAQPVLAIQSMSLAGMVLAVKGKLAEGMWLVADITHPREEEPLSTQVRVAWTREVGPVHYAGLELVGSWEGMGKVRQRLGGFLGSVLFAPTHALGVVVSESQKDATCYDIHTVKVALLTANPNGSYVVRRTNGVHEAESLGLALELAFGVHNGSLRISPAFRLGREQIERTRPETLAPPPPPPAAPLPGQGASQGAPPQAAPAAAPATPGTDTVNTGQEAIFAANTMVLPPDRIQPSEADLLAANTMVLPPDRIDSEEAILGANTMVVSDSAETAPQSRVLSGGGVVGFAAPSGDDSWSLYTIRGRKMAVVASVGELGYRVCIMGDDLEFLEAKTGLEGVALAFGVAAGEASLDPPIPGLL